MTDLTTLLHDRADRARLQPIDLDAVTRTGDSRLRRRRATTYAGALAVTGALTTTALLAWPEHDRALEPAAPGPTAPVTSGASWFLDGRLHHDGTSTDLGIDVVTYVRTGQGFVLLDTDDVVWSWTGGGEPERVGVAAPGSPGLAGDADGDTAAWLDRSGGERRVVMVDQATNDVRALHAVGEGEAAVTAVEGDRVWWVEGEQSLSLTWSSRSLDRYPEGVQVLGVAPGRIVYELDDRVLTTTSTPSGGDRDLVLGDSYRDVGALSPDGALWSADADAVGVVRTSDGSRVPLEVDASFSTGFEWLDAHSLVVLAGDGDLDEGDTMTARVMVCVVPEGTCTDVSGDLGTFGDLEAGDFALPVGVELG